VTQDLPPFAAALPAEAQHTGVGIDASGHLYLYGDDPRAPGQQIPAVTGRPSQLALRMLGARGRYGARPYIELYLDGDCPEGNAVLRIPAARPGPNGFVPTGAARSLVAALSALPPGVASIQIVPKRGELATFLNVFPFDSGGRALPQIRVSPVAADLDALSLAISACCEKLGCAEASLISLLQPSATSASS
jgi:hypothetical protein